MPKNPDRVHEWLEKKRSIKEQRLKRFVAVRLALLTFMGLGLLIVFPFLNPNFNLMFLGTKYKVVLNNLEYPQVYKDRHDKDKILTLDAKNGNGKTKQLVVSETDYDYFFSLNKGEEVAVYLDEQHPSNYYIPRLYKGISLLIFLVAVLLPLLFILFGKTE